MIEDKIQEFCPKIENKNNLNFKPKAKPIVNKQFKPKKQSTNNVSSIRASTAATSKPTNNDPKKSVNLKKSMEVERKTNNLKSKVNKGETNLINIHMNIIKDDANLLTQEGELISNVKGVGEADYEMDVYTKELERIINKKVKLYKELKIKLEIYKYNNMKLKMEKFNLKKEILVLIIIKLNRKIDYR